MITKTRIVKIIVMCLAAMAFALPMNAQSKKGYINRMKQEKQRFSDSLRNEKEAYRRRLNEEYAQFIKERWETFKSHKGEPRPLFPEPPQPYKRDGNVPIPELPNPIPVKPIEVPQPDPTIPKRPDLDLPALPTPPDFSFLTYGTQCKVHTGNSMKFSLKNTNENTISDAWMWLTDNDATASLLADCLEWCNALSLGDWGYFCLLRDMAETLLGKDSNESVLLQLYLMSQSGYMVRIGRINGHLVPLLPFDGDVFVYYYIDLADGRFYIMSEREEGSFDICNRSFSEKASKLSLRMECPPRFAFSPTNTRTFAAKRFPELCVQLEINRNLIDFYNGYPHSLWTNYSWAGLSEEVKAKLYPVLRKGIEGKGQIEAANRIINFVQTAFEYQTDQDQFGYERPLFADETFFYPYSDCEDRAILFSILVRDLLGLDVVLLHYHDHLATAVCYTEELNGYYFELDGKTYYVSDPTYIGANVGECAPPYRNETPKVHKL